MRQPWSALIATSALLLAPLGLHAPLHAQTTPAPLQARVIVKFKTGSPLLRRQVQAASRSGEQAASLGARVGMALSGGAMVSERAQVVTAQGIGSAELAQRLAAQSDVEYAVPDKLRRRFAIPNDPRYQTVPVLAGNGGPVSGQWYLRPPTATVRSAINAEAAWDTTTGSASIVVAVLDTGARYDHNDLGGNLLPGYDMVNDADISSDGDGRDSDASDTGDWNTNANECDTGSSSWHGTQTASLIAALTDNGNGMASVGRTVKVVPVRVLGRCGGFDSDIMAGMRWAAGLAVPGVPDNPNPAKVINMSLGGEGDCEGAYPSTIAEVTAAGTSVVVSAGNSAGHAVAVPANCPGVIAVTGLRHIGTKVGFADVGPEVALAAPGGNCVDISPGAACQYPIITATNAGSTTPVTGSSIYTNSFDAAVGTSFSAPLVAGTVGLMLSVRPALTPAEVREALRASTRPFPTSGSDAGVAACHAPNASEQLECYCTTSTCGAGMLDASVAVVAAQKGVQARITLNNDSPRAPQELTLSAASSFKLASRSIDTYQWTLIDGGGIVTGPIPSGTATTTITPSAAGLVTVSLTVTDSSGAQSTTQRSIDVAAAPVVVQPNPSSGGGGGGALGPVWLLGLAMGVAALQLAPLRRRRAETIRAAAGHSLSAPGNKHP